MANSFKQLAAKISKMETGTERFREILDALPMAIYTTDADGRLTHFNKAAIEFSGRVPELGTDHWCVTWKLFHPDGTPMPHDECPMAVAIKEGRSISGVQAIAERPDGKRIWFEPYPSPLRNKNGKIIGGVNMLIDITESKNLKKLKHQSEDNLNDFFDNAPMGLHIVGRDGIIIRANKTELEMLGYDEDEYIGQHISEFHADKEEIENILQHLKAGEELIDHKAQLVCKDGSVKDVEISSNALMEDGEFINTRCFTRDITQKKQAAKNLQKVSAESQRQKRLYEAIISSTPDLAYVFDLNYRFTFINDSLLQMWGRTLEDSIGKRLQDVGYEPWHVEMHEREIDEVVATKKSVRGEVPFSHAELGERIYDYIFVPVLNKNGEVEAVAGTTRDITDHKNTEESLRQSEQRLRLALDAGQIGSWEWNVKSNEVYWSDRLEKMHGIGIGEFDGTYESFLNVIHPDDKERVTSAFKKALEEKSPYHIKHRWIRKTGENLWVECKGKIITGAEDEPVKMIGTCMDISTQMQNEKLQSVQNELLEQIAKGTPLEKCLSSLCSSVFQLNPGIRAAVLLCDSEHKQFKRVIAPDFPPSFSKKVTNTTIADPSAGTCVEAILKSKPMVCADIPNDSSRSEKWRDLCKKNGFKACISNPIMDENNHSLGTFMISFNEAREPNKWEYRLADFGTHIARIVLDRDRSRQALKENEERFRNTMDQSPLSMQIFDAEGWAIKVNPAWEKMWNTTKEEVGDYNILKDEQLKAQGLDKYIKKAFKGKTVKLPVSSYDPAKIGKKGRKRWIDGYIYPLTSEDGITEEIALIHHDISERKHAEKALRKNEEKYRKLFNSMDQGYCIIEVVFDEENNPVDYIFVETNAAFKKNTGLKDVTGKSMRTIAPGHEDRWFKQYGQVAKTGESMQFEHLATHLDDRWFDVYAYPYEKNSNKVAVLFKDITERKKNEHNNALLSAIVDSSEDAIISKDLNGQITSWNASAERMFGYTAKEAVGRHISMLFPQKKQGEDYVILDQIKSGERVEHFETIRRHKNGKLLNLSLTVSPIHNSSGEIIGASKIARDITRQKKMQEEQEHLLRKVEREQKLLSDVFQKAPSFMCILEGPELKFSQANELFYKIIGERQILGKPLKEALPEIPGQGYFDLLSQVYETGIPFSGTDMKIKLKRNPDSAKLEERYIDVVYQPTHNTEGEISGIFVQGVDLTERNRAKAELQAINETLEERVEERTKALISYQKQLRSLASQLSNAEENERQRLATELHDNLGQILAVGKMKLDLIQKVNLDKDTTDDLQELNNLMDESIRYTRELMTDLKPPPSLKNEDLSASIQWVADRMKKHNLEVIFADDDEPKPLEEETRSTVRQCVRELLFNVVKHGQTNMAHVILTRQENNLQVIVEDKGKGFNLNGEAPSPTKDGGFGLFSIRERMNYLGGSMEIISKKGVGTKVILSAPLFTLENKDEPEKTETTKKEKASEVPKISTNHKTTVLLVDDHQMMRKGLQKMIDSQEDLMVIAEVADGKEALKAAQETSPQVIVMDVNMPGMNGIEATREVHSVMPHIRIIGLSLHDNKDVAEAMRNAGASAYLTKSEAFETLCATIRSEAQLAKQEKK